MEVRPVPKVEAGVSPAAEGWHPAARIAPLASKRRRSKRENSALGSAPWLQGSRDARPAFRLRAASLRNLNWLLFAPEGRLRRTP
jgi:hypothetical protein